MQITDSEAQKQKTGKTTEETLQSLNRDVANANSKLEKQDLTKAQERQEMAQTIGQISEDWLRFVVGDKLKEADKKRQEADAIEKENPTKATALRAQAQAIEAEYGLGSNLQMGVRAATAALQGLAAGSVNQAAVGVVSPYLNKLIKAQTGDNKEANLIAHAVLGAVEAHFTGNNAAAGAVGALTAEAAAPLIMQTLYGVDNPTNLSDSQKQNVANLSQIAAGLSGGLVGDSTGSFVAGAEIGKRAVENNALSLKDVYQYQKSLKAAIQNGRSVEEVHQKFKELSEKQRADLLANCDIECRATVPNELLGAVGFADELSGVLHSWLNGLPLDEQTKFYQLVEEENAKTIEALKAQQTDFEKGIELAMNAAHLFAKEDINNTSSKKSLYDSQKIRQKFEEEFGKENIKSTTVPPNGIRNTKLAGKAHPKTGVPFDTKGYPIFDDIAKYDTRLDIKSFRNSNYTEQMSMATKQLYKELGDVGIQKKFNLKQIEAIKSGKGKIPGFTWHHHQDTGRMQLVPEWEHSRTGHVGGDYIQEGK